LWRINLDLILGKAAAGLGYAQTFPAVPWTRMATLSSGVYNQGPWQCAGPGVSLLASARPRAGTLPAPVAAEAPLAGPGTGKPHGEFGFWNKRSRSDEGNGQGASPRKPGSEGMWFAWRNSGFGFFRVGCSTQSPAEAPARFFAVVQLVKSVAVVCRQQTHSSRRSSASSSGCNQLGNPLFLSACRGSGSHGVFLSSMRSVVRALRGGGAAAAGSISSAELCVEPAPRAALC